MAIRDERARGFIDAEQPSAEDNHLEFGITTDGAIFIKIDNPQQLVICGPEDARYIALTLIEIAHDIEAGHIDIPTIVKGPKGSQ